MNLLGKLGFEKSLAFGLLAGVFAYVAIRAALVPLSFDESVSFFYYIQQGEFWPGIAHWDANNHVLNSLLGTISYSLFGNSEFAIRLPNVLSAILYLAFSYLLSFELKDRWPRWALFLALVFSHFTIEFLGYTRGYGMSMAYMLAALYFVYEWTGSSAKVGSLLAGLAVMQLATLANMSVLIVNLLIWGWVVFWLVLKPAKRTFAAFAILLLSAACIYWFATVSFQMKELGLLYYGSGDGFWEVTVTSLAQNGFGPLGTVVLIFVPVLAVITLIAAFFLLFRSFQNQFRRQLFFAYLLFGSVVAHLMLNWLFQVNFPEDRVGMQYLAFLPLALVYTVVAVADEGMVSDMARKAMQYALIPLLLYPSGFALSVNASHAGLWKADAAVKQFYEELASRSDTKKEQMATITGYHLKRIPFYYYNLRHGDPIHLLQTDAYRGEEADFQIADLSDKGRWDRYDTISYHEPSGQYLLERRQKRQKQMMLTNRLEPKETATDEYYVLYEGDIDSLEGKDLLWRVQMEMTDIPDPIPGWVVAQIDDADGQTQIMVNLFVHWVRASWQAGEAFDQMLMLKDVPAGGTHVKLYYWNIKQRPIAFGQVCASLYEILPDGSTDQPAVQ